MIMAVVEAVILMGIVAVAISVCLNVPSSLLLSVCPLLLSVVVARPSFTRGGSVVDRVSVFGLLEVTSSSSVFSGCSEAAGKDGLTEVQSGVRVVSRTPTLDPI